MYRDMIPAQLHNSLRTPTMPFVLDVREPDEFVEAAIPGAVNIPLGELVSRGREIPRDRPIVVVCRSGNRSSKAAMALARVGLDVSNLVGGMVAWERDQRPVVRGAVGIATADPSEVTSGPIAPPVDAPAGTPTAPVAADSVAAFRSEVLEATVPVVVDFWAPWCGPCRMVAPELENLARAHAGKVKVVKVDVDKAPEVAGRYGVQGIPMIGLFHAGELVATTVGAKPRAAIERDLGLARFAA